MKTLIIALLLFTSSTALAGNFYISAALGVHDEGTDCPEFCYGSNLLAKVTLGYRGELFFTEIEHISAPEITEIGYGGNTAWAGVEHRF